jgi:hypothetical protein
MQPASVPPPKNDAETRDHLRANLQAAAAGDLHPGDWRLHSLFSLEGVSGDFTPVREPDYAELRVTPLGELLEHLAGMVDIEHPGAPAVAGLEAGQ